MLGAVLGILEDLVVDTFNLGDIANFLACLLALSKYLTNLVGAANRAEVWFLHASVGFVSLVSIVSAESAS